ncbi:MAG UNVERIFIED_CONTAM: hypothetical protein LVR18_23210 [Planctomycetaceae bacterium]
MARPRRQFLLSAAGKSENTGIHGIGGNTGTSQLVCSTGVAGAEAGPRSGMGMGTGVSAGGTGIGRTGSSGAEKCSTGPCCRG